ncbi:MAG TPA: FAD-dependent oxidoreductase [Candidatus Cloacimonadota bacterium]|nr:FAD-dependent oxidoreductase [Candidatus Cloacimonadota bacterium]
MIEVILNGKKVETEAGITILELARREGYEIPTLCHDEELNPYGSCWVCAVEVAGRRGFVTSCGTIVSNGMEITTDSPEISAARKMALELLISNHYADCEAPCKVACPDHVDIQSYVSLIANGQYHEAVKVIKDTLPMPLSIGRVCPAFCEKECRRQIVEDPIAIRQLKRYAADEDLNDFWSYLPPREELKGKRVAIIGAGPSGLTCGYYLSTRGYEVDVLESAPAAGGWLRYGIPEYRLPKEILDKEIELMCVNGMKIHYQKELGRDFTLKSLAADYDAVYLAIGAQKAVPMPVKGSDLEGCYLGVDFLKAHALGQAPKLGKRVAIVGGGNTAIDCARTSIRLGCEVSLIYRRTKEEMPAEPFEIEAAGHEGVVFHYLANPVEYLGENGKLHTVRIEKMKLGEPDSSGRRRPEPTGEYFEEQFDTIIAAISQVPEIEIFAENDNYIGESQLPLSRWSTAVVDEATMHTGLANVFAGGDFRRGAATAIEAIADGRTAANAIEKYLCGKEMRPFHPKFDSKKGKAIGDISPEEYADFARIQRVIMPEIPVAEAKRSFTEVEKGFSEKEANTEASRCLECGCQVNETCQLREYCSTHEVDPARFIGSIGKHPIDYTHPFIIRDANKCINCGRCIRTCAEIQGAAVLGYIYRGFPTVVAPEFGESLTATDCECCGKCIAVCPVGALIERNQNYKLNPLPREKCLQNCGICGTGCVIETQTETGVVALITAPEKEEARGFNGRNLCFKGRFGWQAFTAPDRFYRPLQKIAGFWREISWTEATEILKKKLAESTIKRFSISPDITLEEMLIARAAASSCGAELYAPTGSDLFINKYLPMKPLDNALELLDKHKEYVVFGKISHTLRTLLRLRQRQGAKLILVNPEEANFNRFADHIYSSTGEVSANPDQLYIYDLNLSSEADIYKIWKLGASQDPTCANVFTSSDSPNWLGMLAVQPKFEQAEAADLSISWGEYPEAMESGYKVALTPFADEDAPVDLLLPSPSYLEIEGHTLGNMGQINKFHNPSKSMIINELMRVFYTLGLISPATAEINHWNTAVENLLAELGSYNPETFSEKQIDPNDLRLKPLGVKAPLRSRIVKLHLSRKEKTVF